MLTSDAPLRLARAHRAILVASLAAVTMTAWAWLMLEPASRLDSALLMPHCDQRITLGAFLSSVIMWQAMSIAMMAPTTLNWLFAFTALIEHNDPRQRFREVGAFGAGYFVIWLGFSLLAATLQMMLQQSGLLNHSGKLPSSAAGLVLVGAGIVYFTPLSRECLKHCRNPLSYFLEHWENGPRSGFRFGLAHGAYCLGCCWALMLTGFAMGVMNLAWMAFLTILVCVEKLAPRGDRIAGIVAAALMVWGAVLLL
ncbi:MAG: DUF2182 domain-containing protein [Terracidiphilus sp.]